MALLSFTVVIVLSGFVRLNHIYRELDSEFLQYKTKHSGFKGIWMDKHTAEALNELAFWKSHLQEEKILLFDFAACRVGEKTDVPLLGDWLTQEEFPSKALQDRLFEHFKMRQNRYWIVQKYTSAELCDSLIPIQKRNDSLQLGILKMLKQKSIIYNEGKYFIIYRQ